MRGMTLIVQLSDLHIRAHGQLAYGRVDTAACLHQAVGAICRLPQAPDAVLITGDLVDYGRADEYEHLAQLLAPLTQPVYLLPGNHDSAPALRAAFPGHACLGTEGPVQYSLPLGPLQLIGLDTTVAKAPHGELHAQQLQWLEQALDAAAGRPVLLAMHHPPFRTLIGHMDRYGLLRGAEELEALVRRHPNVERIVCGHLHRAIEVRFGGTIASTSPSPAHQVVLDLAPDAPACWNREPGAFRLHAWDAQGGLVSHLAYVQQADGPYPFAEPD
jgi:3',5'-cyclic-AMP phosphodiesterase